MKAGDIVFLQGKGVISKIIRYFDKGTFSHVAIAINSEEVIDTDIGSNVVIRKLDKPKYSVIEIVDLGLNEEQISNVMYTAMCYLGAHYDYISLIWYALRKVFGFKGKNFLNNPYGFICSELVYVALKEKGVLKELGIDETRGFDLTPNELYDLLKYVSS